MKILYPRISSRNKIHLYDSYGDIGHVVTFCSRNIPINRQYLWTLGRFYQFSEIWKNTCRICARDIIPRDVFQNCCGISLLPPPVLNIGLQDGSYYALTS